MSRSRESVKPGIQPPHGSRKRKIGATSDEKPRVQSAARTVGIILAIARSREGLKVKEISMQLKLPRQVTYHLLHTLSATGIIRKRNENRYALGLAAAVIGDGFHRQLGPSEEMATRVRTIAAKCGETTYASGWADGEVAVLATARGHSAVHAAEVPHGCAEAAHARAAGKLLLALADEDLRQDYLSRHRLSACTPNTITTRARLLTELEKIRKAGYAVDREEFAEGLCCLAVPLEGAGGQMVISLSVPAERFKDNFNRYLAVLRTMAKVDFD